MPPQTLESLPLGALPPDSLPASDVPAQRRQRRQFTGHHRKFETVIRRSSLNSDLDQSVHGEDESVSRATNTDDASDAQPPRRLGQATSADTLDCSALGSDSRRRSSTTPDPTSLDSRVSYMTGLSIVSNVDPQAAREERARFLFAKYGLAMSPDFPPKSNQALRRTAEPLQRVQKRVRLRMHATCHVCDTWLGAASSCPGCRHGRCNLCPRAPPKGVQRLVEHTKRQLEALPEPSEECGPEIVEAKDDYAGRNSNVSSGSRTSSSAHSTCPSPPTTTTTRPRDDSRMESTTPDLYDSAMKDVGVPRPLSLPVRVDGYHPTSPHHRDLCHPLETAVAKLCDRQGLNLNRIYRLFPLSFQALQTFANMTRQARVYRPPRFKVRYPCPGCGQVLSGKGGSCRSCSGVGLGEGRHSLSARPLAVC